MDFSWEREEVLEEALLTMDKEELIWIIMGNREWFPFPFGGRILGKKSMAETHAYSYAYNEGHSDSRKTGEYRPSLSTPKQEAAFKRILKQKAEEDEEFPHTKQFLCGLEGHKWKMKPLKKTCKKCGLVIKNRLRGHR